MLIEKLAKDVKSILMDKYKLENRDMSKDNFCYFRVAKISAEGVFSGDLVNSIILLSTSTSVSLFKFRKVFSQK